MAVAGHFLGVFSFPRRGLLVCLGGSARRVKRLQDWLRQSKKPGVAAGLWHIRSSGKRAGYAASSTSSSPSAASGLGPRRGPLASAASISLTASVSVTRCTAEISRDRRSSAAS